MRLSWFVCLKLVVYLVLVVFGFLFCVRIVVEWFVSLVWMVMCCVCMFCSGLMYGQFCGIQCICRQRCWFWQQLGMGSMFDSVIVFVQVVYMGWQYWWMKMFYCSCLSWCWNLFRIMCRVWLLMLCKLLVSILYGRFMDVVVVMSCCCMKGLQLVLVFGGLVNCIFLLGSSFCRELGFMDVSVVLLMLNLIGWFVNVFSFMLVGVGWVMKFVNRFVIFCCMSIVLLKLLSVCRCRSMVVSVEYLCMVFGCIGLNMCWILVVGMCIIFVCVVVCFVLFGCWW